MRYRLDWTIYVSDSMYSMEFYIHLKKSLFSLSDVKVWKKWKLLRPCSHLEKLRNPCENRKKNLFSKIRHDLRDWIETMFCIGVCAKLLVQFSAISPFPLQPFSISPKYKSLEVGGILAQNDMAKGDWLEKDPHDSPSLIQGEGSSVKQVLNTTQGIHFCFSNAVCRCLRFHSE